MKAMISRKNLYRAFITAVGGGVGIGVMIGLARWAEIPLLIVPFTTSNVLVMAAPESTQARPRNIVGGHLLSALCGLGVVILLGNNPWLAALAVGLSIALIAADRHAASAGWNQRAADGVGECIVDVHPHPGDHRCRHSGRLCLCLSPADLARRLAALMVVKHDTVVSVSAFEVVSLI